MKVLGARLVDRSRLDGVMAAAGESLTAEHVPFLTWTFPGELQERFLVLDVEAASPGERATVYVYPVASGGKLEVVVNEAGRSRVSVRLAPRLSAFVQALTVDVEQDGDELWSCEIPIRSAMEAAFARETAPRVPGDTGPASHTDLAGPHELSLTMEPDRLIASFRCAAPTLIVARTANRPTYLTPLEWHSPPFWSAEDMARAEELPMTLRDGVARLLGQSILGEVRLDPRAGRIALVLPTMVPAAAESIAQDLSDLVALLPPPTGEPPPASRRSTGRARPDAGERVCDCQVLAGRVVELERARRICEGRDVLPDRSDPLHAPQWGAHITPRALVLEVQSSSGATLMVRTDPPMLVDALYVLAGRGPQWRLIPMEGVLWDEPALVVWAWSPGGHDLWSLRVRIGLSRRVLLAELAVRLRYASESSERTVLVAAPDAPQVRLELGCAAEPLAAEIPWRGRLGRLLEGAFAWYAREIEASASELEASGSIDFLRARVALPFDLAASAAPRQGDFVIEEEKGDLVLVADVHALDIGALEVVARRALETAAQIGRRIAPRMSRDR